MVARAFWLAFVTMCRRDQSGPNKDSGTNGVGSHQKPEGRPSRAAIPENFGKKEHRLVDSCKGLPRDRHPVRVDKSFQADDLGDITRRFSAGAR
jgi:hypothetical protein